MGLGDVARFTWVDYVVFVIIMLLSSSVGIYYGIKDKRKKRQNVEEFLMGGRHMGVLPVSVSLFVSWLSAISMLGDPVEVYHNGCVYWMIGIGYCLAVPPVAEYFAPVYHQMKLSSAFEYLETRFNFPIRIMASVLQGLGNALYAGVVLYAPAISLAQVSGISVWVSVVAIGLVCTFYTTYGGIKAVLWADTIQTVIMTVGLVAIVIRGCVVLGGVQEVWRINVDRGRINFDNLDPSPLVRSSFWTYLIGGFFRVFNPYLSSQIWIQRYSTLKTKEDAKKAVYWNIPMYFVFVTLFSILGLVMVAYYDGCDPLLDGKIEKADQMVPLITVELLGFVPGFPGLFLASLFCAALSTMSSVQNSLAVNVLSDVVEPFHLYKTKRELPGRTALWISKLLTVLFGLLFIGLALMYVAMKDASVFQITFKISGSLTAPTAGLFFLGLLVPFVDTLSGFLGFLLGFGLVTWWNMGAFFVAARPDEKLPVSTDMCQPFNYSSVFNGTDTPWTTTEQLYTTATAVDEIQRKGFVMEDLYYISPLIYGAIGFFLTLIFGALFGYILKRIFKSHTRNEGTKTYRSVNMAKDGESRL